MPVSRHFSKLEFLITKKVKIIINIFLAPGQMKGQKEAVVILQEIRKIQMKYRRAQKEKRRRSRER